MELAYIWRWFQELSATRQSGMGVGPITYLELEAMCSARLVTLQAWDKALIRRIDDAVRAVLAGDAPKPQPTTTPKASKQIPFNDTAGLRALFDNVAAKKAAEIDARAKKSTRQPKERSEH